MFMFVFIFVYVYSMSKIDVFVHHHGYFARPPNGTIQYVGGKIDQVYEDTETLCFNDLEHYAVAFDYDRGYSLVYFQSDGHSFEKDVRVLSDDATMKELIEICEPFGRIDMFVDHFDLEELETREAIRKENLNNEADVDVDSEDDDPDYVNDFEEDDSDGNPQFEEDESDPELNENVENKKLRKVAEANNVNNSLKMGEGDGEESDYLSDELRSSLSSSSEDETCNKGYIGPPPTNKRKKKRVRAYNPNKPVKFSPGMKFGTMEEFRKAVIDYGIAERRAVQYSHNDIYRCQVVCEKNCPFYIWCKRIRGEETVQIRTLVDEHLCTKPYKNKLASVKYLTELYGEKIRKNPTWKIKIWLRL